MLPLSPSELQLGLLGATQRRCCCPLLLLPRRLGSIQPLHISSTPPSIARLHSSRQGHVVPGAQHGSLHYLASVDRARAHVDSRLALSGDAVALTPGSVRPAASHGITLVPAAASASTEVFSGSNEGQVAAVRRSVGHAGRLSFPAGLGRVSFHRRTPSSQTLVTKVSVRLQSCARCHVHDRTRAATCKAAKAVQQSDLARAIFEVVLSREMAELVARARIVTERRMRSWEQDSAEIKRRLGELGGAGIVAYGLLNTIYYSLAFLGGWYLIAKVPAGLGIHASARKFIEVMAMVWAGSQVTKVPRAGGALALAPFVDRALDAAVVRLSLRSKRDALILVVTGCLVVAAAVFGAVIVMHA